MGGLGFKITMGVIVAVQLLAIGYAAHLVRRTKYSVIWILCIICFAVSLAQHIMHIYSDGTVNYELFITLDAILSVRKVAKFQTTIEVKHRQNSTSLGDLVRIGLTQRNLTII